MTGNQESEIELELTYLAAQIPSEVVGVNPKTLLDVYIPADRNVHSKLRLRKKDDCYEITKKVPLDASDASIQQEFTIPIADYEFEALATASDKQIQKERYEVVIEGYSAEVDIFTGSLQGLVLIDFEFPNEAEKAAFTPPDCCLADVTQEEFIAGGELAGKTYQAIESSLKKFGYTSLI